MSETRQVSTDLDDTYSHHGWMFTAHSRGNGILAPGPNWIYTHVETAIADAITGIQ